MMEITQANSRFWPVCLVECTLILTAAATTATFFGDSRFSLIMRGGARMEIAVNTAHVGF